MKFEEIVKDDFEQYLTLARTFRDIDLTNVDGLLQLSIDSWLLANRWNNIQSEARKIAEQYEVSKTDFNEWAYHIYSLLKELHITTRSWYNNAVKDYELNKQIKGD